MHNLGNDVLLFRENFPSAKGKKWHDTFHRIFNRGTEDADEVAVSCGQAGFESGITGWHFNANYLAVEMAEEHAGMFYDVDFDTLKNHMQELMEIGIQTARELKQIWGDLPKVGNDKDLWSRNLPDDHHLVLPMFPSNVAPQSALDPKTMVQIPMAGIVMNTAKKLSGWRTDVSVLKKSRLVGF
jgi:hypothetical protein